MTHLPGIEDRVEWIGLCLSFGHVNELLDLILVSLAGRDRFLVSLMTSPTQPVDSILEFPVGELARRHVSEKVSPQAPTEQRF